MKKIIVERKEPKQTICVDEVRTGDAVFWRKNPPVGISSPLYKLAKAGTGGYIWTNLSSASWTGDSYGYSREAIEAALNHPDTQEVFVDNEAWKRI